MGRRRFLIQKLNGLKQFDFCDAIQDHFSYQEWATGRNPMQGISFFVSQFPNRPCCIPVGSLKFVFDYMRRYDHLSIPAPRNVPTSLFEFAGRSIVDAISWCKSEHARNVYVKGATFDPSGVKPLSSPGTCLPDSLDVPVQVSDFLEILSEWRIFVFRGKVIGAQNYSGDPGMFPYRMAVQRMVKAFSQDPTSPPAWTLDVGITGIGPKKTVVVEVHDFFSCGLYGLNASTTVANMTEAWYQWYQKKEKSGTPRSPIRCPDPFLFL